MTWIGIRLIVLLSLFVPQNLLAQTIITNAHIETQHLSKTTARAIFAMRVPYWPDGTPIQVFVLEDQNPIHIQFCKSVLGMFPYQLRRIWDRQVFSGTGNSPNVVETEKDMIRAIRQTKGAIGYISEISNSMLEGVQQFEVGL